MKRIICLLALFLVIPFACCAAEIPALNQSGLDKLLKQNEGKVIMINFFATWCPPCRAEIPEIVKLRKKYSPEKLMIIGLSVDDTKEPVPDFLKQTGVNYPVYMADKDITDAYNVSSVPHNAFIARDGRLIISEPGMADAAVLYQVTEDLLKRK